MKKKIDKKGKKIEKVHREQGNINPCRKEKQNSNKKSEIKVKIGNGK